MGTYAHPFSAAVLALLPNSPHPHHKGHAEQQQQQNGVSGPPSEALAGSGLPELLLMSHHPAITAGVSQRPGRRSTWATACHRVRGVQDALKREY